MVRVKLITVFLACDLYMLLGMGVGSALPRACSACMCWLSHSHSALCFLSLYRLCTTSTFLVVSFFLSYLIKYMASRAVDSPSQSSDDTSPERATSTIPTSTCSSGPTELVLDVICW